VPLTPARSLQAKDKLRTGGNARVRMKLREAAR
jgi:hypothetical protein